MSILSGIWNDIKKGENLDLYIAVPVAFTIGILSLFGVTDQPIATGIILAALGILTASSLRDKHANEKTYNYLERTRTDLHHLTALVSERLQNTQTNRTNESRLLQRISSSTEDILSKITISDSLQSAGLGTVYMQSRNIPWDDLFNNVKEVDVFFTYARSWRNYNNNLLDQLIRRPGARLRVVLPDPENNVILQELSNRFTKSPEEFRNLIHEATREYSKMHEIAEKHGAIVELWHASVTPMFSLYRFDKTVVLALGSYKDNKGDVPHFVCQTGGSLYRYAFEEFETLIGVGENGRAIATKIL